MSPAPSRFITCRSILLETIILLLTIMWTPAYGQATSPTLYTDPSQFQAAVPNLNTIDFASALAPGQVLAQITDPAGLTLKGVNFQGLPANFLYVVAPGYGDPYQGWSGNPTVVQSLAPVGNYMMVTLPSGTRAVGT